MNMLNSVILEGNIKGYTKNSEFIDLVVASSRYSKNENNERIETITEVNCRVSGAMRGTAERFAEIGRRVRIVGHLAGTDGHIVLVCEHIEYKLGKKTV